MREMKVKRTGTREHIKGLKKTQESWNVRDEIQVEVQLKYKGKNLKI